MSKAKHTKVQDGWFSPDKSKGKPLFHCFITFSNEYF